ncbi:hypothetical protein M3I54_40705 [Paraburkholderia sp. CNPSo 3274]|uniref:hypothetical protein n=1 Tax=Paraburkholderia sp. CNPSo 3274 TaxID=2940932 RepID=UPI0020B661E7|nr:hypothetical protein [Paraburkholderia sp. CNPSo 3274]MCP3713133.1 hypothetical protein [Paraburkholderia sp. CNPSo 3274]
MHFREQGKVLQLIRTIYDPTVGRGRQSVVAKIPKHTYELPVDIEALLTPEERIQATDYLVTLKAGREKTTNSNTVDYGYVRIERIVTALQAGAKPSEPNTERLWAVIGRLQRALTKAGCARPKKAAKPAADEAPYTTGQEPGLTSLRSVSLSPAES